MSVSLADAGLLVEVVGAGAEVVVGGGAEVVVRWGTDGGDDEQPARISDGSNIKTTMENRRICTCTVFSRRNGSVRCQISTDVRTITGASDLSGIRPCRGLSEPHDAPWQASKFNLRKMPASNAYASTP